MTGVGPGGRLFLTHREAAAAFAGSSATPLAAEAEINSSESVNASVS
jgi:hypothetical protein